MKPEFSLGSDDDLVWIPVRRINIDFGRFNLLTQPSKLVFQLITAIEEGHFPIIYVDIDETPLPESVKAFEAYMRCHISVVPTQFKVKEAKETAKNGNLSPNF